MARTSLALAAVIATAAWAGCAGDATTLEASGAGGGERTASMACDGEGGIADAVLEITAHARLGLVTLLVYDGLGEQVGQRHVSTGSGEVIDALRINGAPGKWSLEERRTSDFDGEFRASLRCGG